MMLMSDDEDVGDVGEDEVECVFFRFSSFSYRFSQSWMGCYVSCCLVLRSVVPMRFDVESIAFGGHHLPTGAFAVSVFRLCSGSSARGQTNRLSLTLDDLPSLFIHEYFSDEAHCKCHKNMLRS
jgi:hypothetical protein